MAKQQPTVSVVNVEALFSALYTKGEAKLSDYATPVDNIKYETYKKK